MRASTQEEYYEAYWKYRISRARLHTKEGMWIPQRIRIALHMIMHAFREGPMSSVSVLDVGCGEGTMGKLIKEQFKGKPEDAPLLIGCDISNRALELARPYYKDVFKLDIERVEFPEKYHTNKLDYIVLLDVLEHLLRPDIALEKCHAILNEDGILVASFPNIAWYRYRIELLKGQFPSDYLFGPSDHVQQFTLSSFTELLEKGGFRKEDMDGEFVLPSLFRPKRVFLTLGRKFPSLFGYQLVIRARKYNKLIAPKA
jgi:2-polyprenyl-3-methyl-5-hydroxy-6-metoxy-1,4-benzoquinol methylase